MSPPRGGRGVSAGDTTGADEGAGGGDDVLNRRAKRRGEKGGVAEERDELSRCEGPVHHVLGAQVRHDCRENRGQQHLARLQTGLRRGDAISRESNDVALALVVIEKDLFAAHAAQDAKSGDGVGAGRRQTSGRFALGGLGGVQRLHQWCRERRQDRHTDDIN